MQRLWKLTPIRAQPRGFGFWAKPHRAFLPVPGLILACLAALLASCGKSPSPTAPPPAVEAAPVLVADVPIFAEYVGQTEATANVDLPARVEGVLEAILFREGSVVQKGDLLFKIEKAPIQERVARARAKLANAAAARDKAQSDIDRYTPLVAQQAIPREDLENAQSAKRQAAAEVDAAEAELRRSLLDLGYTDMKAPIAGLIGAKQADVGDLVGGTHKSVLATISPLDPIWFSAGINEVQYLQAARHLTQKTLPDLPVRLILADGSEHPETGRFVFADRTIDPKTGTIRVRAEFPNPGDVLRPGQFGRLRVLLETRTNATLVPQRSVKEIQGAYSVFTVEQGKAKFTRIQPGPQVGPLWMVESGLQPQDKVIVEGMLKAQDGMPVSVTMTNISDAPVTALKKLIPAPP